MDLIALRTWDDYEDGYPVGLAPGETSVTDALLLDLYRGFPQIGVRRLTPAHENRIGADWEWWIGSPAEGWLCLRIQAKRIYDIGYNALDHKQDGHYQYETLIESCQEPHVLPYHVFYNGWERTRFVGRHGNREDLRALRGNRRHFPYADGPRHAVDDPDWGDIGPRRPNWWGCAAMSTYHVAALHSLPHHKPKRFYTPRYLRHAMPWSRLFGSDQTDELGGLPLPLSLVDKIHRNLVADTASAINAAQPVRGQHAARDVQLVQQLVALEKYIRNGDGRAYRRPLPPYAAAILAQPQGRGLFEDESVVQHPAPATYALITDVSTFGVET